MKKKSSHFTMVFRLYQPQKQKSINEKEVKKAMKHRNNRRIKAILSVAFFIMGILLSPIIFGVNFGFASSWWAILLCWLLSFAMSNEEHSGKIKKKHWLAIPIALIIFIMIRGIWLEHTALYTRLQHAFERPEFADVRIEINVEENQTHNDLYRIRLVYRGEFDTESELREVYDAFSTLLTNILSDYEVTNYRLTFEIFQPGQYEIMVTFCSEMALEIENICTRGINNPHISSESLPRHLSHHMALHKDLWERLIVINPIFDEFLETLESSAMFSFINLEYWARYSSITLNLRLNDDVNHDDFEEIVRFASELIRENTPHNIHWIRIATADQTLENGVVYRLVYRFTDLNETGELRVDFQSDRRITPRTPIFEWDTYNVDSFEEIHEILNTQ